MGYMCLSCHEEYKKENLNLGKEDTCRCPKVKCGGKIIELDDMILPVIKLLNIKGYQSAYCCSGHSYEKICDTYISFESDSIPSYLPSGFELEDEDCYKAHGWRFEDKLGTDIGIRKYHGENLNEYDLHKDICKTMMDLVDWAKELPNINE